LKGNQITDDDNITHADARRRINLKGFRLTKAGRLERDPRRLDVSRRLKQQSSKKIRVKRRGAL
jgi:hypothetical protein